MANIVQYISDLRETDALRQKIDEYLSMCVIPVETESRAPIMANVRIKVLLPLDREVFVAGTVIMHRPDGFLVQMDCTLDLDFLRQTLAEAVAIESGVAPAHAPRPAPAAAVPRQPSAERQPTRAAPVVPAPVKPTGGGISGRVQGNVNITERVDLPESHGEMPRAAESTSGRSARATAPETHDGTPPRKRPRKGEVTASYFEKPSGLDDAPGNRPRPAEADDLTISSISAVDAVTGRPMRSEPHESREPHDAGKEKTVPGFPVDREAMNRLDSEFSRRPPGGGRTEPQLLPPQEVTRKFFSPDILEKARAETLKDAAVSGLVDGAAPVDELFSLAAEAGAIDIADSGLLEIPPEPEKTSPSIPGTVDVTQAIIEATRPRFRRPAEVTRTGEPERTDEPAESYEPDAAEPDAPMPEHEQDPARATEPENRELAVRIREMSTPEKQKLARQGKRIARRILVRDNDKTIHKYVFFNPEIQIDEVIEYTRFNGLAQDAIEFITTNRVWMESRDVVFNIVRNPSTPTELAVRFVIKLSPGDWRMFVRPGVVKPAVMNQARKLLMESEKKF